MKLFHRHEWRWSARHRSPHTMWDIEVCECGARRKGMWMLGLNVDLPAGTTVWHYPTVWWPA